MSLIIEDGTGVSDANSYQDLTDARALSTTVGIALPADDTEAESALLNATMYLQGYEADICGERTTLNQSLMFPRAGSTLRGNAVGDNEIPRDLLIAQLIAAEDFGKSGNAWGGNDDGKVIIGHAAGKVSQQYANNGKSGSSYKIPRLESVMSAFCGLNNRSGSIKLPRV